MRLTKLSDVIDVMQYEGIAFYRGEEPFAVGVNPLGDDIYTIDVPMYHDAEIASGVACGVLAHPGFEDAVPHIYWRSNRRVTPLLVKPDSPMADEVPTSETLVGVSEQPAALCPLIDAVLQLAKSGEPVQLIEDQLEVLRSEVIDLREWGQDWKEEALRRIQIADPQLYDQIIHARTRRGDAD